MLRLLAGLLALLAVFPAAAQEQPGRFDFYVLALSWSPTYCAGPKASPQQCRTGPPRAFVVHGLWPQYETGYPDFCTRQAPYVPDATISAMADLMPSKGLILHEWRKHGTCSGLAPAAYFNLVRKARERVVIPPAFAAPSSAFSMTSAEIEEAFRSVNPSLAPDMMAVDCGEGRLNEVRICLGKDLAFVSCGEVDRRSCSPRRSLNVPAPR
ncbi:ribonuclease T2 [Aquabacter sp. CN5-332]|uniref:ribonuclease T2 n=1 Tax=Aquabacter sp. CN5-332 TaxID=3156608 RepID=UPI0032B30FFC